MTTCLERSEPGATSTDRSQANLGGTWTIDPADSIVSYAGRTLRLWTITGRLHCLGVIHLDELPPVGTIRFHQPSGHPVLTIAVDPASLQTGDADLNAMLCGPDMGAVRRQRWWTLHSQSLEILPSGAWRIMATLTGHRTSGLVELRLEADPKASGRDWLVLRGRGVLDRRAFATGKRASSLDPTIRLELAVHARRVGTRPSTERHEEDSYRRPSVTAEEPVRRGQRAS
jgi:polyisoprenoid-binding protein YceI